MNRNRLRTDARGFTLVELLVVLVIFAIAMVGIFNVFQSSQRSANTQEQVVDLQQNLRVALESITRDLRWAGFLTRSTDNPIATAGANSVVINTISGSGKVAQIAIGFTSPTTTSSEVQITLKEPINLENGDFVRIIRPADASQPVPRVLTVTADSSSTILKVDEFNSEQVFLEGDIVAEYIGATASDLTPNTITYSLSGTDLVRNAGATDQIVASGIAALTFSYLLDDGSEEADSTTIDDLGNIRAVRVTLDGEALTVTGTKIRGMTSLVALRNRK